MKKSILLFSFTFLFSFSIMATTIECDFRPHSTEKSAQTNGNVPTGTEFVFHASSTINKLNVDSDSESCLSFSDGATLTFGEDIVHFTYWGDTATQNVDKSIRGTFDIFRIYNQCDHEVSTYIGVWDITTKKYYSSFKLDIERRGHAQVDVKTNVDILVSADTAASDVPLISNGTSTAYATLHLKPDEYDSSNGVLKNGGEKLLYALTGSTWDEKSNEWIADNLTEEVAFKLGETSATKPGEYTGTITVTLQCD